MQYLMFLFKGLSSRELYGFLKSKLLEKLGRKINYDSPFVDNLFTKYNTLRHVNAQGSGSFINKTQGTQVSLPDSGIFFLRNNTTDFKVFGQVILQKEYFPIVEIINRVSGDEEILVIDIGANIGLSSLFFSRHLKHCRVYSIEPDKNNFSVLQKNITLNDLSEKVTPVNRAFWPEKVYLKKENTLRDDREWGYRYTEANELDYESESLTIDDIYLMAASEKIDFIKMDIEGTEKLILENFNMTEKLLKNVKYFAVEIHQHDVFDTNKNLIISNIRKLGYNTFEKGETLFAHK